MNELLSDVRFWFTAMGLGLLGLMRLVWNKTEKRIESLEADAVRRKEFDQLRADRMAQYQESRETWQRIEMKIDSNEERSANTRHDTNESVHALAVQIAALKRDQRDVR